MTGLDRTEGLNRAQRRKLSGGRKDPSVIYAEDGTRIGYTVFHSKSGLNSTKVCDTPALAQVSDYSDLRGSCDHAAQTPVIVSVWGDDAIWWPSVLCTSCRQLTGRRDPYFSIEGDLITLDRGTALMQAEWQFWRASGWPRVGRPRFGVEPPGKRLGLPLVMWVDPYRLFSGWEQTGVDTWAHPMLGDNLVLRRRDATPEDAEHLDLGVSIEGERVAETASAVVTDPPESNVVKLRSPKLAPDEVWVFLIDRRGDGNIESSVPFATRPEALEAALSILFDMQATLATRVAGIARKQRPEEKPEVILPPGVS